MRRLRGFVLVPALLSALALPLAADDHGPYGDRFGIGLYGIQPEGGWRDAYDPGWQASIHVHTNLGSRFMGRVYVDFTNASTKDRLLIDGQPQKVRRERTGAGYEWMVHFADEHGAWGPYFLAGLGGSWWRDHYGDTTKHHDLAFTPSAGLGFRFNPYAALELRQVWSEADDEQGGFRTERNFWSAGLSVRF